MNYAALKTELAKSNYTALSNADAAAAVNAATQTTYVDIQTADIKKYLFMNDLLLPLQAVVGSNSNAAITMAALTSFDLLETSEDAVRAKVDSIMRALVTDSLIKQADHDAIMAMATTQEPLWQSLNLGSAVTDYDVGVARAA